MLYVTMEPQHVSVVVSLACIFADVSKCTAHSLYMAPLSCITNVAAYHMFFPYLSHIYLHAVQKCLLALGSDCGTWVNLVTKTIMEQTILWFTPGQDSFQYDHLCAPAACLLLCILPGTS